MAFEIVECLLLDLLKSRNMSQSEFARRLKVTRQFVRKLITCEKIMSHTMAINAAHILNCEISDLYKTIFQQEEE